MDIDVDVCELTHLAKSLFLVTTSVRETPFALVKSIYGGFMGFPKIGVPHSYPLIIYCNGGFHEIHHVHPWLWKPPYLAEPSCAVLVPRLEGLSQCHARRVRNTQNWSCFQERMIDLVKLNLFHSILTFPTSVLDWFRSINEEKCQSRTTERLLTTNLYLANVGMVDIPLDNIWRNTTPWGPHSNKLTYTN